MLARLRGLLLCATVSPLAWACASATRTGAPDPEQETRFESATRPARPARVVFDWSLTDRDARFSGRGVLRMDAGYRARVDLFGPRGETLAAAIADEAGMRVVPEAAAAMLPPAALLWSTLGVFRRPVDALLTGTAAADDETTLVYTRDKAVWRFRFRGDRLMTTEWTDGEGRRTVTIERSGPRALPDRATFRDWTQFRELSIRVTELEEGTAGFEPDTWILPGER